MQAGGLYNGVVILQDRETQTYWNHISGAAVHGPLKGCQLATWSVTFSTLGQLRQWRPDALLLHGSQNTSFLKRLFIYFQRLMVWLGFLPALFTKTMPAEDSRLRRFTLGLGVVHQDTSMFFPVDAVKAAHARTGSWPEVEWPGVADCKLVVAEESGTGVLAAHWKAGGSARDNASMPQQYFMRWYGFSLQYPEVQVFGALQNTE